MARGDAEMRIRVPHDVKAWIEKEAKDNLRTQNAQIVHVLKEAKAAEDDTVQSKPPAA